MRKSFLVRFGSRADQAKKELLSSSLFCLRVRCYLQGTARSHSIRFSLFLKFISKLIIFKHSIQMCESILKVEEQLS